MATAPDLGGVDLKIKRARRHLAELKPAIEAALHPDGFSFALDYDPATGKHLYRVHGVPVIDPEWRLVVGEILFNLRSALDHLAWQLVIFDGKTPGYQTQFPIRTSPLNRAGVRTPTQLNPEVDSPDILRLLEEVQPYVGVQGGPQDYWIDPLWILGRLNNIDKHRLLLVVLCILDVSEMWWGLPADFPSPDVEINPNALRDGDPVIWFDFHGRELPSGFDPHPALQITLSEFEVPRIGRVPITSALENLCWWVDDNILDWRFRPLLVPGFNSWTRRA